MLKFLENPHNRKCQKDSKKYRPELTFGISHEYPSNFHTPYTLYHKNSHHIHLAKIYLGKQNTRQPNPPFPHTILQKPNLGSLDEKREKVKRTAMVFSSMKNKKHCSVKEKENYDQTKKHIQIYSKNNGKQELSENFIDQQQFSSSLQKKQNKLKKSYSMKLNLLLTKRVNYKSQYKISHNSKLQCNRYFDNQTIKNKNQKTFFIEKQQIRKNRIKLALNKSKKNFLIIRPPRFNTQYNNQIKQNLVNHTKCHFYKTEGKFQKIEKFEKSEKESDYQMEKDLEIFENNLMRKFK